MHNFQKIQTSHLSLNHIPDFLNSWALLSISLPWPPLSSSSLVSILTGSGSSLQLGSLRNSELVLELGINNTLEPAYESRLDIEFPASVSYIGTGPDSKLNLPVTGKTLSSVRLEAIEMKKYSGLF